MGNKELPEGWKWVKLSDASQITMGQSPTSDTYNSEQIGLPFFQGKAEFTELSPIVKVWTSKPKKIAQTNDILLSVRAPVGTTNLANQECCIGRGLAAIRFENYKYGFYYLRSKQQELDSKGTGTTFRAISGETLRETLFPLPPLLTQQAIVSKIEELFSELDKGIENLKTAQQQLKVYRQAVLKWAFEGKLTNGLNQDANDWSDEQELAMVAELGGVYQKAKSLNHDLNANNAKLHAGNQDTGGLPEGWKNVLLKEITKVISDGDHQAPPKAKQGVPFITISNVDKSNNKIDFSNTFFVEDDYYSALKENRKPMIGDILYTVTGSYGIPIIIDFEKDFCFQRHIGLIRPLDNVSQKWMFYLLQSHSVFNQAKSTATGTAQKTVALSSLRNFKVPYCNFKEQTQIVQEIESRLSVADKMEESIRQSLLQAESLRQSILKKAFEGGLIK